MPAIRENDGDEDQDNDERQQTNAEHVEVEREEREQEPEVEVIEDDGRGGEEDDGDERVASSNDDDDERPARHRESAKERRERARKAKQRDKMELDFQKREMDRLQRTVHELTQSQIGSRVTELDNRANSANAEVDQWERVQAAAIAKQNGADAVAAQKLRDEAIRKRDQAVWEKNQIVQAARQPQQQAPSYEPLARQFMADNPWYDHSGGDEDSLIVKAIDAAVAKQYNPNDPAYWNELQKRVDARLGKQTRRQQRQDTRRDDAEDGDDYEEAPVQRTRKGPPTGGSSRGNSSSGSTQQIRLSPERVQGLKDAGLWEDPKDRMRMAKKYAEYDRQNRG
jgi:hypothetical protein